MARPNCGNFFGPKIIKAIMLMTTRLVGPVMPKIKVLVIMIINLTHKSVSYTHLTLPTK